jgi:hypothetical protein
MNETLVKLLLVGMGDEDPNILNRFDRRIAMQPEVDDFEGYLRQQFHEGHIEYWLQTYEDMTKKWPNDPIMYFNVAKVCTVWSDELESDYLNSKTDHSMSLEEWMHSEDTTYREFLSLGWKAANCLEKIIEMTPDLPANIVAAMLVNISDLRHPATS